MRKSKGKEIKKIDRQHFYIIAQMDHDHSMIMDLLFSDLINKINELCKRVNRLTYEK